MAPYYTSWQITHDRLLLNILSRTENDNIIKIQPYEYNIRKRIEEIDLWNDRCVLIYPAQNAVNLYLEKW